MRLIVTHPSCSIKTLPCCSTSRFIVCHPGRPGPLPWSFTGSAAADARRGRRCRPGCPGPYRGRSLAAPLLMPAADADVAQAVPASPRPFADSTAAATYRGPAITLPMSPRPPWPPTVVVHRQRRC